MSWPVLIALAAVAAAGCTGAPASARAATGDVSLIKIESFDCQGAGGASVLGWHGPGPGGANLNVRDLRCRVAVAASCGIGEVAVTLRVGSRVVAETVVKVGAGAVELDVPYARWSRNLDEPPAEFAHYRPPYRTAAFRALARLACSSPVAVAPADWRHSSVTAEAMFVAGFARR